MKLKKALRSTFHFKCDSPENTVKRIETGFRKLGIEARYMHYSFPGSSDFSWGRLIVPELNFVTQGKGCTPELAKASTYAEMAERISCGLFFKTSYIDPDMEDHSPGMCTRFLNFEHLQGYTYGHQDRIDGAVSIEELLEKERSLKEEDIKRIKESEIARHWVDAFSLIKEKDKKVPLVFVKRISGSNGLASGNTLEEAISQASFEIFERHALIKAVRETLPIPSIEIDSIDDPLIRRMMMFFRKNRYDIIVKDFSHGGIFPCLGVLFINRATAQSDNVIKKALGSKTVRVAASFNPVEALRRCFTERLQNLSFDDLRFQHGFDVLWEGWFKKRNIPYRPTPNCGLLMRNGLYGGDLSFLEEGNRIDFEAFKENETYDCLKEIEHIKKVCSGIHTDFLVVDQTHPVLGFPSVRVIIPGISDILPFYPFSHKTERPLTTFDTWYWESPIRNDHYSVFVSDSGWCGSDEKIKILIAELENRLTSYPQDLQFITRGFNNRSINLIEFLASLYFKTGDIDNFRCTMEILASGYPREKEIYNRLARYAEQHDRLAIESEMKKMKGCYRFLIERPYRNPFTAWCDQPCERECQERYKTALIQIMRSFFS